MKLETYTFNAWNRQFSISKYEALQCPSLHLHVDSSSIPWSTIITNCSCDHLSMLHLLTSKIMTRANHIRHLRFHIMTLEMQTTKGSPLLLSVWRPSHRHTEHRHTEPSAAKIRWCVHGQNWGCSQQSARRVTGLEEHSFPRSFLQALWKRTSTCYGSFEILCNFRAFVRRLLNEVWYATGTRTVENALALFHFRVEGICQVELPQARSRASVHSHFWFLLYRPRNMRSFLLLPSESDNWNLITTHIIWIDAMCLCGADYKLSWI